MPEQSQFALDVFISYSHKDEAWVTKTLLPKLEDADLKVCIDFRDFKAGRASIFNMQDAVRSCQRTLLVLTPNWFASEWALFESILIGRSSPAGLKERLIPALLQPCEMPPDADFIANLTYVDLTRPDRLENAWIQLLTALGKPPEPESPPQPERTGWHLVHPYAMPPNFTGRRDERALLTGWLQGGAQNATISGWLNNDPAHPLLVLRALGGFGKSALAWQWLTHDVDPARWPHAVWWSFYEGDASFDSFVRETLEYLSGGKLKIGGQVTPQDVKALLAELHTPGTVLVLDGFERELRAFGGIGAAYQGDDVPHDEAGERVCISPLAEAFLHDVVTLPGIKAKVLLTTRLRPHAVETRDGQMLTGCREEELKQMQPADAVGFFRAQGIRGTHTEIEAACEPYGYHPLSLRLLAGLIARDFQQPGDIAATNRLDVSGDLVQRQHHVIETAFDSLTAERQALLGRIACFRSPVSYEALRALAETEERGFRSASTPSANATVKRLERRAPALDADLQDLVARGLLHHDTKGGRFDLHPIVRRYAYDRLAAPDRAAAHTRLRDYFAAVPKPDKVTRLDDLAPLIELYHHTVRAGQFDEALMLYRDRLGDPIYYQLGAYQTSADLVRALFPDGEDHLPRLRSESDQAWTLNSLANSYSLSGLPDRAVPLFEQHNAIYEKAGNKSNLAIGLANLVHEVRTPTGAFRLAESNLVRGLALCREIRSELDEAICHQDLGRVFGYRGQWPQAETEIEAAKKLHKAIHPSQHKVWAWWIDARCIQLRLRSRLANGNLSSSIADSNSSLGEFRLAISKAHDALKIADEWNRGNYPIERHYVRAYWLLGSAHRMAGELGEAERHLHEALERCRRINDVMDEADILIDLARLRHATGVLDEAERLAEESLVITERSGYVLQGADVHLELAKLTLARNDKAGARKHAQQAKDLATCDGPPDYTYKVAYDEAEALLKQLDP